MTPVDMTTDTKAMILAAGYGTRMMPLSRHLPKPLLPVLGKPVINHQASLLAAAGIHEAVVNIHHLGGLIRQHVAENGLEGLRVEFSDETTELLGTGGGLKKALAIIGRESTIILINGDTILEYDIGILIAFHRKMRSAVTLLLKDVPGTPDEHAVWMDSDGLVKRFAGKGAPPDGLKCCAFLGIHVVEPVVFNFLPDSGCVIRGCYRRLLEKGYTISGHLCDVFFTDVGSPMALLDANLLMLARTGKSRHIGSGCTLGDDAVLGPGTVLSGGNAVGNGVSISDSLVLFGESIEDGERLHRTVAGFGMRLQV